MNPVVITLEKNGCLQINKAISITIKNFNLQMESSWTAEYFLKTSNDPEIVIEVLF